MGNSKFDCTRLNTEVHKCLEYTQQIHTGTHRFLSPTQTQKCEHVTQL